MKKSNVIVIVCVSLIILMTSCATVNKIFGKSSSAENKAKAKVENVEKDQVENERKKMEQIAVLASGTDYALNKVTNKEPAVDAAQSLNHRVISLAGKPNLDAEKEMWRIVDQLTSQLVNEKALGEKALLKKDKEIINLQEESKSLAIAKDKEIQKYMKIASDTAGLADARAVELDEYKGWFGLKAVGKGLWQFIKSSAWFLGIGTVLFLVLRFASATNPVASAIFNVFSMIGGYFIKGIKVLIPRAVEFSGNIATSAYNAYETLLTKIIDSIESIKAIQKATGRDITLKEVLLELDKTMDTAEKAIVDKLRKDLGY